jgi:uncharacterized membrane protein
MARKTFSIKQAIRYGWKTTLSQPIIILYFFIAMFGPQIVEFLFNFIFPEASESIASIFSTVMTILSIVLSIGMVRLALRIYEKKTLKVENLYEDWKLIGWYLLAGLLNGLAVILGLILLIIPGIYVGLRLSLWPYFMLEGEKNSIDALKKSWKASEGYSLKLLGFYLVQLLVVILGVLTLVLGVFVAIPVINLALVSVYKKISLSQPQKVLEKKS